MESRLIATIGPPLLPVSMSVTPSTCTLLVLGRCPLALIALDACPVGVGCPFTTTPGARNAKPKKSRPLTATFCTTWPSIAYERSALWVWSGVASADTLTVSETPPTSSVTVTRDSLSFAFTTTFLRSTALNPSALTLSV